jgi:hypothetical protein
MQAHAAWGAYEFSHRVSMVLLGFLESGLVCFLVRLLRLLQLLGLLLLRTTSIEHCGTGGGCYVSHGSRLGAGQGRDRYEMYYELIAHPKTVDSIKGEQGPGWNRVVNVLCATERSDWEQIYKMGENKYGDRVGGPAQFANF